MELLVIIITFLTLFFIFGKNNEPTSNQPSHVPSTEWSIADKKAYLRSSEYRNGIRKQALIRDSYSCIICGSRHLTEVHHITYDRLGREHLEDLVCLCKYHHQEIHDKYGYGYDGHYPVL